MVPKHVTTMLAHVLAPSPQSAALTGTARPNTPMQWLCCKASSTSSTSCAAQTSRDVCDHVSFGHPSGEGDQSYFRRWTRRGFQNRHGRRGHTNENPRRGSLWKRRRARLRQVVGHLTSSSSSATSSSLVEHGALASLVTPSLCQLTLDNFLNFAAHQNWPTSSNAPVLRNTATPSTSLECKITRATCCVHRYRRCSRPGGGKALRFHRCVLGWTLMTLGRARKAFSLNVLCAIAAKLALAHHRRMAAFLLLVRFCSRDHRSWYRSAPPSPCGHPRVCSPFVLFRKIVRARRQNFTEVSIFLDWKWCLRMDKGRDHPARGRQGGARVFFLPLPVADGINQSVPALEPPVRDNLFCTTFRSRQQSGF